jgi:hypothetical protein
MTSSAPFTARFPLFGPAVPTPTGARFPARCGYYSLCSVRKPRKRCGVFGVQWTPYLLTQHSTLLLSGASHVFGGWRHGPCHRPACLFCHSGQAQDAAGVGLVVPSPHPSFSGAAVLQAPNRCISAGRTPSGSQIDFGS